MADLAQMLETLMRSEVFAPDFPRRKRLTHAEMLGQSEVDQIDSADPAREAIHRVPNVHAPVDIVRHLGNARYEAAIPTLAVIWRECSLIPLRNGAGHALRAMGSADARNVLTELIDDGDWFSVHIAIRAVFDAAPLSAYDRLISYFDADRVRMPGGHVIPWYALMMFSPTSFTAKGPVWTEPRAPQWLREDRRWIDLCVKLRRDEFLGDRARDVLRYVEADLFEPALARAIEKEGPKINKPSIQAFGDLVTRYRRGDHIQVWQVLRSFDAMGGDLRKEAEDVAVETMKRVGHNVDLLALRLKEKGWQALGGKLRTKPDPGDAPIFDEITRITRGPIPPSLLAFWQVVGGVDFVWNYHRDEKPPDLLAGVEFTGLDPLRIDAPAQVEYLFDEWEETIEKTRPELIDPFSLQLAPDYLHKADISGGAPYAVELPFFCADPLFRNEEHRLPFVDYLRHSLRWAGFSRLERHASVDGVANLVRTLTKGFEPF